MADATPATSPLFEFLVESPAALPDAAIPVAACQAGATGVLNLEWARDGAAVRAALAQLQEAGGAWGVKLSTRSRETRAVVVEALPPTVPLAILSDDGGEPDDLLDLVGLLRDRRARILLEVTDAGRCHRAIDIGADGLIAKGNEAGGRAGEEGTFVLLQRVLRATSLPVWAHGGIGVHTVAACRVAGAAGAVLDAQVLLTRESPLPDAAKRAITRTDGSETVYAGGSFGEGYRIYAGSSARAAEQLRRIEQDLAADGARTRAALLSDWRHAVAERIGWAEPERCAWPLGQDGAFAGSLARRFATVGGVIAGLRDAIAAYPAVARRLRPLGEGAPLARSHGTRYPIVQGPMTRVSDRAEFALRVAEAGALPFLALALMRGPEVAALLEDTRRLLADRPWGVGILGFVPAALRQEQLDVIRRVRPPFALIAGGRPDQARALEGDGIATYLHVPSPGLLRLFLQDGARRFVFEGRECGGHVGPRTSFVLWNTAVDALLEELPPGAAADCHVIFAGGVHDALSASMVAALAAPLAERGVRVGVLLGTAYLFTREAVRTGAIVPGFQEAALECRGTVLLETGPGHSTRCAPTPYTEDFDRERRRLVGEGRSAEEVRQELEILNLGRLRIAAKGVTRRADGPGQPERAPRAASTAADGATRGPDGPAQHERTPLTAVSAAEQRHAGMYMIGQAAALRDRIGTIAELHDDVAAGSTRRLGAAAPRADSAPPFPSGERGAGVAIVGMSAILPKASDLRTYWENILNKVSAIAEVPEDRWDWALYFDPDPATPDKIYSRWGGFIDDVAFDPVEFGMPPNALPSIDPMQLLALRAARCAMEDAGYSERPFDRERAAVILGASGGTGDLGTRYVLRASLPLLFGAAAWDVIAQADGALPEWTEDSFAGLLPNVAAGRISNRLDLGGVNYTVDAACASSLSAVHVAVRELESGGTDLVLAGGFDTTQNPFGYLCFSKTRALSPSGQPRTFDTAADGIAIGEGVVMMVLKRLEDAERDGDRIYAVIRAVEGSSDGRAKGLTAPRPEGQMLALERAYARAGVSPTTVGLFEAHGTGTVVGDHTEALALSTFLDKAGAAPRTAAIGSVKSMIGHTKAAAGVAGLAKAAMALYHKVLPPTLGVTRPNPKARFDDGPLYVNSETRPWIHATEAHPRRAGVSAFGFGGTNFHAVLEEYAPGAPSSPPLERWPAEVFVWSANSRAELSGRLTALASALDHGARPELASLSHTLWRHASAGSAAGSRSPRERLAIVAGSTEDLRAGLDQALAALAGAPSDADTASVWLGGGGADPGQVVFLFPDVTSVYPNMLRDLAVMFPEVRAEFERADRAREGEPAGLLSQRVFPPPAFASVEDAAQRDALAAPDVARPALGAASAALCRLLETLGVLPDVLAGQGQGEYVALTVAGALDLSAASGVAPVKILGAPRRPIIWGATGAPCPSDPSSLAACVGDHDARPVPLADRVERLHAEGARVFVEVGPSDALTGQVRQALGPRPHLAIAMDTPGHAGLTSLLRALARLLVAGAPVNLDRLFRGRPVRALDLNRLAEEFSDEPLSPTAWLVNGSRARPARAARAASPGPARPSDISPPAMVAGQPRHSPAPTSTLAPAASARSAPLAGSMRSDPAISSTPAAPAASTARPRGADRVPAPRADGESGQVMLEFQGLMNRFLETQHNLMTAFLATRPGGPKGSAPPRERPAATTATAPPRPAALVAPSPGANGATSPPDPTTDARPAAPAVSPEASPPPPLAPAEPPTAPSREQLTRCLLDIVSERTGYPGEMLDLDADLEADLGVDSIKRVEILGSLQRSSAAGDLAAIRDGMEELARVKTLRGIVQWVEEAIGAGTAPAASARATTSPYEGRGPLPLLRRATIAPAAGGVDVLRRLEPAHDLYLTDHVLDGKAVLPAAMALEMIAEVAQAGWPHLTFTGLRDVRLLRGLVLDAGFLDLRVEARAVPSSADDASHLDVRVEIQNAEGPARPYYRGIVSLGPALPEAPVHRPTLIEDLEPFPLSVDAAYREWLFHGPLMQGIAEIRGISGRGVVATCRPSAPAECLAGGEPGQWLLDPVACDSGLQLILLWARARHGMTTLPSYLSRYRHFRSDPGPVIGCHIQTEVLLDGHVVRSTMALVSDDGRVAGLFEGLECTGSATFNRLGGGHPQPSGARGKR